MFQGKVVLITGGTGSLGQALTRRLLKNGVKTIRIFSRNENKQIEMESQLDDKRLRFLLGDIRDLRRLDKAMEDIDIVGKFDNSLLTFIALLFILVASGATNLIANYVPSQNSIINFFPNKFSQRSSKAKSS